MRKLRKYKLVRGGTPEEKFLRNISINENGCWIWLGARNDSDYGQIGINNKMVYVHRWAYEFYKEPIQPGRHIDHLCRNHPCCNPDHLEPVSPGENARRGMSPGMVIARTNKCIHGHPLTPGNIHIRKDNGGRVCNRCAAIRMAGYALKKKQTTAA